MDSTSDIVCVFVVVVVSVVGCLCVCQKTDVEMWTAGAHIYIFLSSLSDISFSVFLSLRLDALNVYTLSVHDRNLGNEGDRLIWVRGKSQRGK